MKKEYKWRVDKNFILIKQQKTYNGDNNMYSSISSQNKDIMLIGKNLEPDNKKIPCGGNYIWYDNELHEMYKKNDVSIEDVWKYREYGYQKIFKAKTEK